MEGTMLLLRYYNMLRRDAWSHIGKGKESKTMVREKERIVRQLT